MDGKILDTDEVHTPYSLMTRLIRAALCKKKTILNFPERRRGAEFLITFSHDESFESLSKSKFSQCRGF